MRHDFVIGPLCDHELFTGKARLYYCIRCNWRFLVRDRRVLVLDEAGRVLPQGALASFEAYEQGACPARKNAATEAVNGYVIHMKPQRKNCEFRNLDSRHRSVGVTSPRPLQRVFDRV